MSDKSKANILSLPGKVEKKTKKGYAPLAAGTPKDWATFEKIQKMLNPGEVDLKEEFDIESSGEVVGKEDLNLGIDTPRAAAKAGPKGPGRQGPRYAPPGYDAAYNPRAGTPRGNGQAFDEFGNPIDLDD